MIDLVVAAETARRGLSPDRLVHEYGWASDDGTVILSAPPASPERAQLLGVECLVKVTATGEVTSGTTVWFMSDIERMDRVGNWPEA